LMIWMNIVSTGARDDFKRLECTYPGLDRLGGASAVGSDDRGAVGDVSVAVDDLDGQALKCECAADS
jgi:hypothetical protein